MGIQLHPNRRFVGPATTVSGNTISYGYPIPSVPDQERTCYLHVLSGPGKGFVSDITAFTETGIVCADDLAPWVTPGILTMIRPHPSLADIFGVTNRFGLGSGPDAASADNVVIWDAATQQERVYYFQSDRNRWEQKDVEADASKTSIRFPHALYIVRRATEPMRIALTGEIGYEPVLLPVKTGANVFSLPVNLSASLNALITSEGPYSILKGRNANRADLLTFEEPATRVQKGPFYYRSRPNDSGWREVGVNGSDQPLQPLDMLSTLTLRRQGVPGYVLAEGSLDPSPNGPPPIHPDPIEGELPITMEFPFHVNPHPSLVFTLEKSVDLQTWGPTSFTIEGQRIVFPLPTGESRAFYRVTVTEL